MTLETEVNTQATTIVTRPYQLNATPELLTPQDLQAILHITKSTVEQWRLKGIGPKFVRLPGSRLIRYRRQDVADYIAALVAVSSTTEADHVA